jgi:glycosyltransferase involved in cell wall biosynthesis
MTDVAYLSDWWRWLGKRSSYGLLPQYVAQIDRTVRVTDTPARLLNRIVGQLRAPAQRPWRNWGYYPGSEAAFLRELSRRPGCIGHILYFERHHHLLRRWTEAPRTIVATLHHPPVQQKEFPRRFLDDLQRLHSAIVLYSCDLNLFEEQLGSRSVTFIPHGVDTDFFVPALEPPGLRRLLYVGINGRDFRMLAEVVTRLTREEPDVYFDFVVSKSPRLLHALWRHPRIRWHSSITDNQLRSLYQASYLLLLPLKMSGANNAVLEAMACGVPPITTDVGGIRDYGGGSVYPLVPPNDDSAMVHLIQDYLHDPTWRSRIGSACRDFAQQRLSWPIVARKHLDFYRKMDGA